MRAAVESLVGRVALLTELSTQYGVPIPPMADHEQRLITQACDNLDLDITRVMPPSQQETAVVPQQIPSETSNNQHINSLTTSHAQDGIGMNMLMNTDQVNQTLLDTQNWSDFPAEQQWDGSQTWDGSPSDWSWQMLNDFSVLPSFNYGLSAETLMANSNVGAGDFRNDVREDQPASSGSSDDEADNDMVPGLAARLGSLRVASDGRLRYYGTAANNHFLASSSYGGNVFDVQEMQRNASMALENAHLDQDIPTSLRDHLIGLFFQWHNPAHTTIDRSLFEAALPKSGENQGEWCSQSLVAAM